MSVSDYDKLLGKSQPVRVCTAKSIEGENMSFNATLKAIDLLDSAYVDGEQVVNYVQSLGDIQTHIVKVKGEQGHTDFIQMVIKGTKGKLAGGNAPTLGIIGRLGGIGARPEMIGIVSDGDGAVTAVACAIKLSVMAGRGDRLPGDVVVSTHICPDAPTAPHDPVPFMGSPVGIEVMNKYEVTDDMDAILSIDTTKGNRVINHKGFAISPTVKEGYILKTSEDLLDIMTFTTGKLPVVFPITTQDITPYGNGIYHLNSILQPCTVTSAPVVGVAITTESAVPGCGTGASHVVDIEQAVRFSLEVAKNFGASKCKFYDEVEFQKLIRLYGSLNVLQTLGSKTKGK